MNIIYRKAFVDEAEAMVDVYNKAFYDDYIRYGVCPGYGHSVEYMEKSIRENLKYAILDENHMIGAISVSNREEGAYHIGCLCVIPEYQGKGIGTEAIDFFTK
jgi:ribosomal protein S18 acetylase RimI-like enzyme